MSNKEGHKKLWTWLAEHPGKLKSDYFLQHKIPIPKYLCYACEEAYIRRCVADSLISMCEKCPICSGVFLSDDCLNGLFEQWVDAFGNNELRTELALKIANLEWSD